MNTLDRFTKIISLVKESGLCDSFLKTARKHLDAVSSMLGINHIQAVIFGLLLDRFGESSVSIGNIAKTLKCEKIELLKYMDDFDVLKEKN